MCCILTRTTGRTWPNTKLPSLSSNNSLGCHCMKKERGDEELSHRVLGGIDWKDCSRRRPRWIVASLSRCEADGRCRNQTGEFFQAGFYGHLDGNTPSIDRSPAGSGADLHSTVAEYWCENGQGRAEIGRRRDPHHRQCRCRRKETGLRPSAVFRLYPESVCRCYIPLRPKRTAAIQSLQPGARGDRTGVTSSQ